MVVRELDGIGYGVFSAHVFLGAEMIAFEHEFEFEPRVWEKA